MTTITKKEQIAEFEKHLKSYQKTILFDLLQQHNIPPNQFAHIIMTEMKGNPLMMEAFEKNPSSLFASIIHCAEIGLSPSRYVGEVYFLPQNGNIIPLVGYKGLCALMMRGNLVKIIHAESVHRGDEFEYELGLNPKLVHKPKNLVRNSSTLTYVYAIAVLSNGERMFKVMSTQEIRMVMGAMSDVSSLYFNDVKDPMLWMPKKTCIKQLAKLLPKDYYGNQALSVDDKVEGGSYLILDENNRPILQATQSQKNKKPSKNLYANLTNLNQESINLQNADETTITMADS